MLIIKSANESNYRKSPGVVFAFNSLMKLFGKTSKTLQLFVSFFASSRTYENSISVHSMEKECILSHSLFPLMSFCLKMRM